MYSISDLDNILRIRFLTSHPNDMSRKLIETIRDLPKVCKSINLPFQAGSNRILANMRRGYTRDQYLKKIEEIKSIVPDATITTDLIVGFPGETEKDFEDSLEILNLVKFDKVHVAAYSERKGTYAFRKIDDNLTQQEKRRRLNVVNELQDKIQFELNSKYLDSEQDVLVEGYIRNKLYGRTEGDKLVYIENADDSVIGKIQKTKIIEIVSENWKSNLPKAFTIYGNSLNEYIKLIDVAKKNKADWIILQPLIKKNTTDEDCYKFFKKLIPLANETIVGIQNAKEYLGVGLSVKKIKKLSNSFPNFSVIKNESSSVFIQEEINQLSKDVRMFNGRGGQEVVDNFLVGCKGIVPALEMADKFIKIYKLIKNKEINKANRQYAQIAPDIIFVMQSIDTLITYGKRICGYRMGMKDIYDRKPILKPTQYGMIKAKQIAKNLGKF